MERLIIKNRGRIGLGSPCPTYTLDIQGGLDYVDEWDERLLIEYEREQLLIGRRNKLERLQKIMEEK